MNKLFIIIIDSNNHNNINFFNKENRLIYSFSGYLPTKVVSLNDMFIVHSTYSEIISVIDAENYNKTDYTVPDKVSFMYYLNEKYFIMTYDMKLYETKDFKQFDLIKIMDEDYFLDAYVEYKEYIYCISFTNNKIFIFDKRDKSFVNTILLHHNYMPNDIEVYENKIYVVDKETGYIYIYDIKSKLQVKDGFFSNKERFGIADPIGIVRIDNNIYVLNWLKNSIIKYKEKNEENKKN